MGDKSKIEWTDATWNPMRGCTKISAGCKHCYAETFANRFRGTPGPWERGFEPRFIRSALALPMRWTRPRRVFVNSMSDLFHDSFTDGEIAAVFGVMAACPQHTFLVLTKRPIRMRQWFANLDHAYGMVSDGQVRSCIGCLDVLGNRSTHIEYPAWPLPNVLMGVSCETQETYEERCAIMKASKIHRWFISFEPLLGPINFHSYRTNTAWAIVGAESGKGARPFELDWARGIRDVCRMFSIPFFFKQILDERGRKVSMPLLDGMRWEQFPEVST